MLQTLHKTYLLILLVSQYHTVATKVALVKAVSPSGAILYTAELYPGSTLDIAIVEYNRLLEKFQDSDLIQANVG